MPTPHQLRASRVRANAWVEVDLMQEHLNFWTKMIYKVHGSNVLWDWLAMITPCIDLLRKLATQMNTTLGAKQGNKHKTPDLHQDVKELMRSLREHDVYQVVRGRTVDVDKGVVPNMITVGLSHLGSALKDFNAAFKELQDRLTLQPLVGGMYPASERPADPIQSVGFDRGRAEAEGFEAHETDVNVSSDSEKESGNSADDGEDLYFSLESAEDVALNMDSVEGSFLE